MLPQFQAAKEPLMHGQRSGPLRLLAPPARMAAHLGGVQAGPDAGSLSQHRRLLLPQPLHLGGCCSGFDGIWRSSLCLLALKGRRQGRPAGSDGSCEPDLLLQNAHRRLHASSVWHGGSGQ